MQYEDLTDEEVMRLLAATTGRKQNGIIRDIERRTEKARKAVTRDYVDPEAARNAAVYEVTTPQGIERFLASEKKNLSAWTATIAAKRIGQDAGLVGQGMRTDAMYAAGSWDQRLEERGNAAYDGASIPVPQREEGLRAAVLRHEFERITGPQGEREETARLTEKQRAAVIRYANLHKDDAPAMLATFDEVASALGLASKRGAHKPRPARTCTYRCRPRPALANRRTLRHRDGHDDHVHPRTYRGDGCMTINVIEPLPKPLPANPALVTHWPIGRQEVHAQARFLGYLDTLIGRPTETLWLCASQRDSVERRRDAVADAASLILPVTLDTYDEVIDTLVIRLREWDERGVGRLSLPETLYAQRPEEGTAKSEATGRTAASSRRPDASSGQTSTPTAATRRPRARRIRCRHPKRGGASLSGLPAISDLPPCSWSPAAAGSRSTSARPMP